MRPGASLRTPEPGQLYEYHLGRLDWVDQMVANHGLRRALSATTPKNCNHCREQLPSHILPKSFEYRLELPRNANGGTEKCAADRDLGSSVNCGREKQGVAG
jgi:hypothetical protein